MCRNGDYSNKYKRHGRKRIENREINVLIVIKTINKMFTINITGMFVYLYLINIDNFLWYGLILSIT